MLSPTELYPLVLLWLQALGLTAHPTAQTALAHLLTALLGAQSLRSAALMRALLSPRPVPARQRYKRLARAWTRPWLSSPRLSAGLVRAALALVAPDGAPWPTAGLTHLALDSVRCGRWEVFTLGVVWHGRTLPVGWAVLAYPWPKKQFTPTVCALIRQVAAVWPRERPAHLVADRAFPSRALFLTLQALGWDWTIRLRAKSWITVAGQAQWARERLAQAAVGRWQQVAGGYGSGPGAITGQLVVGRGLPLVPWPQRGPASLARREQQHARRQQRLASKHRRAQPDASRETDAWIILFTSLTGWRAATSGYRRRWATEGSYRDAQGGWDGQHGWDLEPVLARLADPHTVERVVGLWALGCLLQSWVGDQVGASSAPAPVRAVVAQWATTGRLSVWARGRLAFTDPSGPLHDYVEQVLAAGAARIAAPPLGPAARSPHRPPGAAAASAPGAA
jgi:hypothetical protein